MNTVWNLDPIYEGFEDPAFVRDLTDFQNLAHALTDFSQSLNTLSGIEGLRRGIALEEETTKLAEKLAGYAMLRQAADTTNPTISSQLGRIMAVVSETAAPLAAFQSWASQLPDLMALVKGDDVLKEYTFLFENLADSSRYLLPGIGESVAAKMQRSGSDAWSEMHQYLTSTVPVHYRNSVINLSSVRNLAYSSDPQVRRDAYRAELACYETIKAPAAYAMNAIKLETISDCQLRGYASPLERTLKQANMQRATLDAMLGAMDTYLPKFWKYLKQKGKLLGHEKGLPWYDLFAPMGSSSTKYTTEDARNYLVDLFSGFDADLAQMVAQAFDNAWIDFYPRDGKAGGAFCETVASIGESRILTNFDGMLTDVVTLAHELGHAFHNLCIRDHRPLNHDYSMPLAETASTFNECVVMNAAIRNAANDDERLALIESQLQDVTQIICDIYSRYKFETMVFANREESFLDADTLCRYMTQAQKEAYGDGLDPDTLHPFMWVCKSHYYGPTFYNFPYAFGGLFARGLYAQYEKEGAAFVPKYKKLLHTTTVATAEDTAKVADIDLTDIHFWQDALQTVADQIDLFCALTEHCAQ